VFDFRDRRTKGFRIKHLGIASAGTIRTGFAARSPRTTHMTTKIISTYIMAGYSLATIYDTLEITPTGGVGGYGVTLNAAARLVNEAFISASGSSNGVTTEAAASIVNGSANDKQVVIRGYSGVFAPDASATISNFGTILGRGQYGNGVFLVAGGVVTNGASNATVAYIEGVQSAVTASAVAKVTNFGTLTGEASYGVYLKAGGSVTNGSASDFRALIKGRTGVFSASGATVANFRTIEGEGTVGVGVQINGGGTPPTPGSTGCSRASISRAWARWSISERSRRPRVRASISGRVGRSPVARRPMSGPSSRAPTAGSTGRSPQPR
jgi:hypothetical protein